MLARHLPALLLAGLLGLAAAPVQAQALPSWPAFAANAQAQVQFDRGRHLAWTQDRAGAIAAFRAARLADPGCALCFWGEACALGSNLTEPMTIADNEAALDALAQAARLAPAVGQRAVDLVAALAARHSADPLASQPVLDRAYAQAMLDLVERYPENEIAVLAAAALIALQDGSLMPEDDARIAEDAAAILDEVLGIAACPERIDDAAARREAPNPAHVGAQRLIRHEIEAGYLPERRAGL
jgi:hypothetical protein